MSCNVVLYVPSGQHLWHWFDAMGAGLKKHGCNVHIGSLPSLRGADLAVTWGHRAHKVYVRQRERGLRYLVMERAYFRDRTAFVSLGFDGLNGHADFCNTNSPSDRWRKHGVEIAEWKLRPAGHVLVCGQVPRDASVLGINVYQWAAHAISVLEGRGARALWRPHPLDPENPGNVRPLAEDLAGARYVVTYNSNAAVDAVLAGVPTVALDSGSMAWAVTGHDLAGFPPTPDRRQWANDLAYCQWTVDEVASGEAWDHLKGGMKC